jgi:hypothetical protein
MDGGKCCAYDYPFLSTILFPSKPKLLSLADVIYSYQHKIRITEEKIRKYGGEAGKISREIWGGSKSMRLLPRPQ